MTSSHRHVDHELERRGRILAKKNPAIGRSIAEAFVLKDQGVFLVTERGGEIPEGGPHGFGLYYHDCRFLSAYALTIDGRTPITLASTPADGYRGIVELTNPDLPRPEGGTLDKHEISIRWDRLLEGERRALHDVLRVRNFGDEAVDVVLRLSFHAGFEDIFIVRGMVGERPGTLHPARWEGESLHLRYDGADGLTRATVVRFWRPPDETRGQEARFALRLESEAEEEVALSVFLTESEGKPGEAPPPARPDLARIASTRRAAEKTQFLAFTSVETDHAPLEDALARSVGDLAMLRSALSDQTFYAAGVPWFVALFGRDALIVALSALAYNQDIARDTLRLLARHQGTKDDPSRDEEPGKILHEYRVGELAHIGAVPQTPYYGTVDATPLFLVLVAAHAAWRGDLGLFHELRPSVDAALGWIAHHGEAEMKGYVAYRSRATDGMANHGWKDSGDAIVMENGELARQPIALVEVQGYVFLAKTILAGLFDRAGEPEVAARLRGEARALKERFRRDFWLSDEGFFAMALTAGGPAKVLSSNPGHALFAGIVDDEDARRTAASLLSEPMWSGWGIRTLSSDARRYNPVAYHRGTVWPHDNAIAVAGFRRYGLDAEACRVFQGILDASAHFPMHRLPELFTGFGRAEYHVPVRYPVACHPQAWAAGALPFMLTSLLGLAPDAFANRLRIVRPVLPEAIGRVTLRGLRVGRGAVDLGFTRGKGGAIAVRVLRSEGGVAVVVE